MWRSVGGSRRAMATPRSMRTSAPAPRATTALRSARLLCEHQLQQCGRLQEHRIGHEQQCARFEEHRVRGELQQRGRLRQLRQREGYCAGLSQLREVGGQQCGGLQEHRFGEQRRCFWLREPGDLHQRQRVRQRQSGEQHRRERDGLHQYRFGKQERQRGRCRQQRDPGRRQRLRIRQYRVGQCAGPGECVRLQEQRAGRQGNGRRVCGNTTSISAAKQRDRLQEQRDGRPEQRSRRGQQCRRRRRQRGRLQEHDVGLCQ